MRKIPAESAVELCDHLAIGNDFVWLEPTNRFTETGRAMITKVLSQGFAVRLAYPNADFPDLPGLTATEHVHLFRFTGQLRKEHRKTLELLRHDPSPVLMEIDNSDAEPLLEQVYARIGNRRGWFWQNDTNILTRGMLADLTQRSYPGHSARLALLLERIGLENRELIGEIIADPAADCCGTADQARFLAKKLALPRSRVYRFLEGRLTTAEVDPSPNPPVRFWIQGHPSLRATHHKTLEVKREDSLSQKETCVVGVAADWSPQTVKRLQGRVCITIRCEEQVDSFKATICPLFNNLNRMVFRKSERQDAITIASHSEKGAADLNRTLMARLAHKEVRAEFIISQLDEASLC